MGLIMSAETIRAVLPGLTDEQYALRDKLRMAREFASVKIIENISDDERAIYLILVDTVTSCLYATMKDEALEACVAYCRLLLKCARGAEWFWSNAD